MVELLLAAACVAAFLLLFSQLLAWRRILGLGLALDLLFSPLVFSSFGGSLQGLLIAVLAGLQMSLLMKLGRKFARYETPRLFWLNLRPYIMWTPKPAPAPAPAPRFAGLPRLPRFAVLTQLRAVWPTREKSRPIRKEATI